MEKECSVYIDEAGDLGVRRGTQWFVLTAVIVDQEDEPQIREILKSVRNKLNLNTIHFRNLSGFEQRAFVVNSLSDTHFEYINIIIDTNKLDLSRLRLEKSERPGIILYNYAYRRNGATNRYGMKYYTDDMKPDAEYFRSHMVCK